MNGLIAAAFSRTGAVLMTFVLLSAIGIASYIQIPKGGVGQDRHCYVVDGGVDDGRQALRDKLDRVAVSERACGNAAVIAVD